MSKKPRKLKPGSRPPNDRGQGRKKGVPLTMSERMHRKAVINKKKNNETPLTYMLRAMRDPRTSQKRKDEMARAVAPYIHPRLTTQKLVGGNPDKGDMPLQHKFQIELVPAKSNQDDDEVEQSDDSKIIDVPKKEEEEPGS